MAKNQPTPESPRRSQRMTVPKFAALKGATKISMVTAYDYPFARLVDEAGVEGVLVGDSMSMVVQGHENTLPVTLDEMIYHAEMVGRAATHALVVVDMPFPSCHLGVYKAVENAGRILKETRCQAVKLEGGTDQAEVIAELLARRSSVPVMDALKRTRYTTTQTQFDRHERMENLRGAFRVRHPPAVQNRHFILVDDVFTTGATVYCAVAVPAASA